MQVGGAFTGYRVQYAPGNESLPALVDPELFALASADAAPLGTSRGSCSYARACVLAPAAQRDGATAPVEGALRLEQHVPSSPWDADNTRVVHNPGLAACRADHVQ